MTMKSLFIWSFLITLLGVVFVLPKVGVIGIIGMASAIAGYLLVVPLRAVRTVFAALKPR